MIKKTLLIFAMLAFVGCSSVPMKKEAFGKGKKFAVVTIFTHNGIGNVNDSGDLSRELINDFPGVLDSLLKDINVFSYVPSKEVLGSKYYKSFPFEKPPKIIGIAPDGYNYIYGLSRPKEFVRNSEYDGIIIMQVVNAMEYGRATTTLVVTILDKNGKMVWFNNKIWIKSDNVISDKEYKERKVPEDTIKKLVTESMNNAVNLWKKLLEEEYMKN